MGDGAPSVGDIVHYVSYGTPGGEYEPEHRAAIVSAVPVKGRDVFYGQGVVSLVVLNPTGLFFNVVVAHDEDEKRGGSWHWPERGAKETEMADATDLASTEDVEDESGDATDAPEYWKPELLPPEVAALGREAVARLREALRGKTFQNFDVDVAKAVLAEYGAHYLVRCYAETGED